eukprot:GEMP01031498.1.p1 GENE.GEMP01031498.1~~GEMP01031498.1.p1  ORF type:complete len:316 (+),score=86.48 GEMP01031498.1:52-999(+)
MHNFPVKGKGKGGPKPIDHDKNRAVLDQLLPLVASKIDENGGVMRISDIATLQDVKALISQVPARCPKALPLILTQWTDFFVNMPNGLVGTAMGYDTGMIREDGSLDPAFASTFAETAAPFEDLSKIKEKKPVDLTTAADDLWRCALNLDNDAELKAAYKAVEQARQHVRGEDGIAPPMHPNGAPWSGQPQQNSKKGGPANQKKGGSIGGINLSDQERCTRKEKILHRCVEILTRCPNQTKQMCLLVSDPSIRELKKGAISKFLTFLQDFPKMFKIVNVEGTPQYNITLLDRQVPFIKPKGIEPVNKKLKVDTFL